MTYVSWISTSLAACVLLASCGDKSYTKLPDGSKWRLVSFGEQNYCVDSATLAYLDVFSITSSGDTAEVLEYEPFDVGKDQLWQVLRTCFSGDSIAYISVGLDFLHLPQYRGDTLQYGIRIGRLRSAEELKDASFIELQFLETFARADTAGLYKEHEGIFFKSLGFTDTTLVKTGKEVAIHYTGKLISEEIIDDTRSRNAPMRFVYGNQDQVIVGLEKALELMHRGEKAEVIIPSWLAFGSRGSAGGMVPPYATLVFEIEVVALAK